MTRDGHPIAWTCIAISTTFGCEYRCEFENETTRIIGALGSAAAWPLAARAQQIGPMRRVGVLLTMAASDSGAQPRVLAVGKGLLETGWSEGHNVEINYRWAAGNLDLIKADAAALIAAAPDVLLAVSPAALAALQPMTSTIPIVFLQVPDPVGVGFVASLAQPGGNVTGFTTFEPSTGGKWLELLKQIAPAVSRLSVIIEANTTGYVLFWRAIEASAPALQVEVSAAEVHDAADIEHAIDLAARAPNSGLIVLPSAVVIGNRELIVALAAQYRIPAVYPFRYFAASGGLLSYGIDSLDVFRRAGSYVGRILSGEKPSNLPVQQPTKFELVLNLKTAKALGLEVPPTLSAIADEVIE